MQTDLTPSLSRQQAPLIAQMVKHPSAMQETWVQSLGWEDRLEKEPAPVSLPGKVHGQRSLEGYSRWVAKSRTRLSD